MNTVLEDLTDRDRLSRHLERLGTKRSMRFKRDDAAESGVPLALLIRDRRQIARLLAHSLRDRTYHLSPSRLRLARLNKPRLLHTFSPLDLVVHTALAEMLRDRMEPKLSSQLYSYRKGRSPWTALGDFAGYVRRHRSANPSPLSRGLHVFRGDIQNYGDSIPIHGKAEIWQQVWDLLDPPPDGATWSLIQTAVRPEIQRDDGTRYRRDLGLPTGSPIVPPLDNLYLSNLDHELAGIEGGFYARYGDDMLYAHPDAEVFRWAMNHLTTVTRDLHLRVHPDKTRFLFFNAAGRCSPVYPEAHGSASITYLECDVHFRGQVGLSPRKCHETIRELRRRLGRVVGMLPPGDRAHRARDLCRVVNSSLDPGNPLSLAVSAPLRSAVTDRRQLKELDYQVAEMIAEVLTGRHGPRCFREIPYRWLRTEGGLVSLVMQRNRHARRREAGARS